MGRLLEALRSETRSVANPANSANQGVQRGVQGAEISRLARLAAPLVARDEKPEGQSKPAVKDKPCDETVLQARCMIACDGLPILPMAIYESLTAEDRAAQRRGEEGPEVLRAYAEAIADRLKASDEDTAEYLAEREAVCAESGEPLRHARPVFRFKLAWNPDTWHYLILAPGNDLSEARARLKREHGKALLWTEVHKPGMALRALRA